MTHSCVPRVHAGLKTRRVGSASSPYRREDRRIGRFVPAPTSSTPIGSGAPSISASQWRKARLGSCQTPAVALEDIWEQCSWLHDEEGGGECDRRRRQTAAEFVPPGSRESSYLSRTPSTPQYASDSPGGSSLQARGSVTHAGAVCRIPSPHSNKTDFNTLGTFLPLPTVDDTTHLSDKEGTPKYLVPNSSRTWAAMDSASPFSTTVLPQPTSSTTDAQQSGSFRLRNPVEKESTHSYSPSREPPVGCDSSLASPNRKRSQCIPQDDCVTQSSTLKASQSPRRRAVANRSPFLHGYKTNQSGQEGHANQVDPDTSDPTTTTLSSHASSSDQYQGPHTSSHQLDGLIEAKEKIISQKDRIIERYCKYNIM